MSAVVLDASVAVALVVDEPGSQVAANAMIGLDPFVPEAFWVETANALVGKVRYEALGRDEAIEAYALLRRLVEYSVPAEPLGPLAIVLALDLGHSVYDCLYLAAAIAHEAPLLTADRALYAKAVDAGYGASVRLAG